jgi:hypothetical protein
MIDTGRHFQPVDSIKRLINSLPYAKMNVLHWYVPTTGYPRHDYRAALNCVRASNAGT